MASRFISNLAVLLAGATLAVVTFALPVTAVAWIGFGVGCFVVTATLAAFPVRGRGHGQRGIDALVALIAGWTIVASLVFTGATVKWLVFGGGCSLALLAFAGLVMHEVRMERYVRHSRRQAGDGRVTQLPERAPIGVAS